MEGWFRWFLRLYGWLYLSHRFWKQLSMVYLCSSQFKLTSRKTSDALWVERCACALFSASCSTMEELHDFWLAQWVWNQYSSGSCCVWALQYEALDRGEQCRLVLTSVVHLCASKYVCIRASDQHTWCWPCSMHRGIVCCNEWFWSYQ